MLGESPVFLVLLKNLLPLQTWLGSNLPRMKYSTTRIQEEMHGWEKWPCPEGFFQPLPSNLQSPGCLWHINLNGPPHSSSGTVDAFSGNKGSVCIKITSVMFFKSIYIIYWVDVLPLVSQAPGIFASNPSVFHFQKHGAWAMSSNEHQKIGGYTPPLQQTRQ